uniref:G_PROTEIN_RECEP_F1_2 domain-containing protein n=1 Tax=Steinernema glaseri TaxID=37863 RepID=A0A1I8AI76_9BILA
MLCAYFLFSVSSLPTTCEVSVIISFLAMQNSSFVFGAEVQGTGQPTAKDVAIGSAVFFLAVLTLLLGLANLYFIRKVQTFHNAFGWFWASRTVAEMLVELNHAVYNAPVTILQPTSIPVAVGVIPYLVMYIGAVCSCLMHEIISVNRFIAVHSAVKYRLIFSRRRCMYLIVGCWVYCIISVPAYIVIPCNLIGYSPTLYEYVFLECSEDMQRHISIVGTTVNIFCMVLCSFTLLTDFLTLIKIISIRKSLTSIGNEKNIRRDIRFFAQSAFQNVIMIVVVVMVVYANNRNNPDNEIINILGFSTMSVLHVANALSPIFFNPEIRNRLVKGSKPSSSDQQANQSNFRVGASRVEPSEQCKW